MVVLIPENKTLIPDLFLVLCQNSNPTLCAVLATDIFKDMDVEDYLHIYMLINGCNFGELFFNNHPNIFSNVLKLIQKTTMGDT